MSVPNEKIVYVDPKAMTRKRPPYNVRPWHRYWARMIDVFIFSVILDIALLYVFDLFGLNIVERIVLSICFLLAWLPVEAVLLSVLGTTAGKWLFNIQIRDEQGEKLSFRAAMNRGFKVFVRGMGGGIPLVSFLCLINAHSKLVYEGTASWDKGDIKVTHIPLGIFKKLICFAVVIGYLYLRFIEKINLF